MEKQFLSQRDFTDHVRAAIVNDREWSDAFTRNAETYNMGGFDWDDLAACIFISKEALKKHVQEFWPWLEFWDFDLYHALMQIMREFVAENE